MCFKNRLIIITALILINITFLSVDLFLTKANAEVVIEPFQKFLIEGMSLSNTNRLILGDFLRDNIASQADVTSQNIVSVSVYVPTLNTAEISTALTVYANRSSDAKMGINSLIYGGIKTMNGSTTGFTNIVKEFNEVVTGDPNDSRGIGIINTILLEMKSLTDITGFAYNGTPDKKIKFELLGFRFLKGQISSAINLFASLTNVITPYEGANNFDKMLNYSQTIVNKYTNMEIWEFKRFLVANSLFSDTPAALTLSNFVGDINGDNVVNASDILYFKLYLLNRITEFPIDNKVQVADLNGDNVINVNDILYMKLYLLNRIASFPRSFN